MFDISFNVNATAEELSISLWLHGKDKSSKCVNSVSLQIILKDEYGEFSPLLSQINMNENQSLMG